MPKPAGGTATGRRGSSEFAKVALALGQRLRKLRADRGWTQRAAALRIGIGAPVLRRLEAGRTNPSLAVLLSLARTFRVPLKHLLRR